MTCAQRLQAAFSSAPGHNRGIGGQATFQYLIVAYELTPFAVDILFYTVYEVALQLVYILQVLALHPFLAVGTGAPAILGSLVASDMYVLRGEKLYHLV